MTKKERELAKWFLDKEWNEAEKYGSHLSYLHSMGWIFYNSLNLLNKPVLEMALSGLETIKQKSPGTYQNSMTRCKRDLEKLEPEAEPDNIVAFPAAGGVR